MKILLCVVIACTLIGAIRNDDVAVNIQNDSEPKFEETTQSSVTNTTISALDSTTQNPAEKISNENTTVSPVESSTQQLTPAENISNHETTVSPVDSSTQKQPSVTQKKKDKKKTTTKKPKASKQQAKTITPKPTVKTSNDTEIQNSTLSAVDENLKMDNTTEVAPVAELENPEYYQPENDQENHNVNTRDAATAANETQEHVENHTETHLNQETTTDQQIITSTDHETSTTTEETSTHEPTTTTQDEITTTGKFGGKNSTPSTTTTMTTTTTTKTTTIMTTTTKTTTIMTTTTKTITIITTSTTLPSKPFNKRQETELPSSSNTDASVSYGILASTVVLSLFSYIFC